MKRRGFREHNNRMGYKPAPRPGFVRPQQVAPLFGVNASTVRRWCELGHFPEAAHNAEGEWEIPVSSLVSRIEEKLVIDEPTLLERIGTVLCEAAVAMGAEAEGTEWNELLLTFPDGQVFLLTISTPETGLGRS